jgi:hypothetical protein
MLGVDIAALPPSRWADVAVASRARLEQIGSVNIENLPLLDASVDVVVSQFGIEYADHRRALREADRVLVADGAMRFVLHHAQGLPARLARIELAHIDGLLADMGGLIPATRRVLEPFARSATSAGRASLASDPFAAAARDAFNAAMEATSRSAAQSACPDVLDETQSLAASTLDTAAHGDLAGAERMLDRWSAGLADARTRLQELVACSLHAESIAEFGGIIAAAGRIVRTGVLRAGDELLAWWLEADPSR